MFDNILETIGHTPLVRLGRFSPNLFAKVERFNPGGSVKDRIALSMIEDAEKKGLLKKGATIIEPTSGNTGIGLAMVAAVKGYKAIFTMPEDMSIERRKLLMAYGAGIVLTPKEKGMAGSVEKAKELARENGYYMAQQFGNTANPRVHELTTAPEIIHDLGELVPDYFVAGVGTGGTITGAGKVLKGKYPHLKVIAVEPADSPVLSGGKPSPHKIQGIGAGFVPDVYNSKIVDEVMAVSSHDAISAAKTLAKKEGILAGISSGAALYAALLIAEKNFGSAIVVVLPDTGERYLSTELF